MRLTCPNCKAQYEVDDKVIPENGRDVQCSACGNTWYQYPMEVALQMRAAEAEDDDEDEDSTPPAPSDGTGRASTPRIDKTVLDVLREEAERELGERRRSKGDLETQGDLGLTRPTRSRAAPSRVYGDDDPAPEPIAEAEEPRPATRQPGERDPVRRRNLLPDIEELTSTLEPGSERRADRNEDTGSEASAASDGRGFRNGLSMVALIAMFLVAIYMLAPLIAAYVPALESTLRTYVELVDGLRAMVSGQLRGLIGG